MKLPVRPAVFVTLMLALAGSAWALPLRAEARGPAAGSGGAGDPTPTPTPSDPFDPLLFGATPDSGAPPEFFGEEEPAGVTRSQERVEDAPGLIAVVGEREIAERGYRTLADLLSDVPGFYVEPDERRELVFARGVPQSVLVVYDGVPLVFDSGRDDIPFGEELSLANVRRVEVLRGPGTALWGANAFNGIVNVVSTDGRDIDGVRARVDGGAALDRNLASAGASAGTRGKNVEWSLSARGARLDGPGRRYLDTPQSYVLLDPVSIPTGPRRDGTGDAAPGLFGEAVGKIRVKRFEIAGRWSELNSHGALSSYSHSLIEKDRNEKRHIPSASLRAGWSRPWANGSVGASAFLLQSRHDDRYPLFALRPVHPYGGQIDVRSRTTTGGVDARGDATFGRNTLSGGLVAGISDSRIETDYVSPTTGTLTKNAFERDFRNLVTQVYAQDRVLFFDDKVRFTLGASVDDQTDYQPSVNPRAGVVIRVAPGWIAKALYGEAIRTPDSYDLVGLTSGAGSGSLSAVEGNPDLLPEKVRTAEIAGEYRRGSLAYASVALFASRFDDLIEEHAAGGEVQPVNSGRRYAAGVETLGRLAARSWLSLNGAYTFARIADDTDTFDHPIAASPEHVLSAGATISPRPWLSLYTGERAVARREARGDANTDRLGPYALTDLNLRVTPVRYFSASLRVTNLFDARYYHRNERVPGRNDAVEIPGDRMRAVLSVEGEVLMRHLLFCAALLPALLAAPASRAQTPPRIVVVLKAGTAKGPLAPYEKAAKAFKTALQPKAEVLIESGSLASAVSSVQAESPDLLVAFGTEAAQFAEKNFPAIPRVVALAPGAEASSAAQTACTVITPEISPELQVKWIDETLLDVTSVGVIYDPRASQRRIDELVAAAAARPAGGVEIVPIPVASESEVPAAFTAFKKNRLAKKTALLFIPDRTVVTGGTLGYLFKETLAASIPVVGFNSSFAENGAVLSFSVDYTAVGLQAAAAARTLPPAGPGWVEAPKKVTVWVNQRVAEKINVRTDYDLDKVQEIH